MSYKFVDRQQNSEEPNYSRLSNLCNFYSFLIKCELQNYSQSDLKTHNCCFHVIVLSLIFSFPCLFFLIYSFSAPPLISPSFLIFISPPLLCFFSLFLQFFSLPFSFLCTSPFSALLFSVPLQSNSSLGRLVI